MEEGELTLLTLILSYCSFAAHAQ